MGVINTVSNPVDWTRLKNVPAGIADGVDDAGGVGDGYSLDASDGSPVDALYVNPGGDVGIGTTAPQRELSIYRDGGALVYSHYTNGTTGANSSDGLICGINGSGNTFLWNHEDTPLTFGTNNVSRMKLTETGVLELGNETVSDGRLELYRAGTTGQIYRLGDIYDDGASFHLYNDTPLRYAAFEPDAAGVGGAWVHLSGSAGSGLTYDGNYSSEPRLTMSGTGQYFDFSFNLSGDASVTLPTSSISASEVLDEAGAANITDYTTVYLVEGIQVLESRTITAPAPGYILAIATGEFSVTHTNGITSRVDIGVSDASGSWPSSNDVDLQVSSNAPSGIYAFPVTVHGFFETSGGSKTIYFLADEQSSSVATMDRNFTLIYVPTAYGTVDPDLAVYGESDEPTNERSALTESDIALERSQSEADNQSRIERELEEMRARLAALEAEVASQH